MDTERESEDLEEEEEGYESDEDGSNSGYNWKREEYKRYLNDWPDGVYSRAREVTISAFTETGKEESVIPVLDQRSYTGRMVIPSALADARCTDLGVNGVLDKLNAAFGTSHPLDSVMLHLLQSVLPSYIGEDSDFGTVYAYLRAYWYVISDIENILREREEKDWEMRRKALEVDGRISPKKVSPRRVWDLCANRVVPYWVAADDAWGISHAWVDEKDRVDVWTPINGNQWHVPMPNDADLNLIRIEMLNKGVTYAWLDVLCLRQKYDAREDHLEEDCRREDLRVEEWQLDVPTIGLVYDDAHVVYYLSGLGRPLSLTPGYFDSDRCWFRRAWTLQEVNFGIYRGLVGGSTGDVDIDSMFHGRLQALRQIESVEDALSEMQKWVSTNPTDRVAGLAYFLCPTYIPTYHANQSEESAWEALIDAMNHTSRMRLLFCYPGPGNGSKRWRPSWQQAMKTTLISLGGRDCQSQTRRMMMDKDSYLVGQIDSAHVRGLSNTANHEEPRQGELVVEDDIGACHTFNILAKHQYSIPDGLYTLLGRYGCFYHPSYCYPYLYDVVWAVGQQKQDGTFEKMSVFEMESREAVSHLKRLGIIGPSNWVSLC